jgi:hypothetical protein
MQLVHKCFICEDLLFTPISLVCFTVRALKGFIMPSKNFTDHDIANLLLSEENNSKDDFWSDDE